MFDSVPKNLLKEAKLLARNRKMTSAEVKKVVKKVKEEYEAAKINPGESIGIITAESFGEPGTQMCVSHDEKVILKFKNRIKVMKVGKFVNDVFEKVEIRKINDYEIYNIRDDLLVLSLDNNEKLKWKKVLALNRIKSPKKLINIITKTGRKITATDYHSFVTRDHNKIIPIAGKDLRIGNRIPVMKYLPENCASSIMVDDHLEDKGKIRSRTNVKNIPNTIQLDKSFGWLIGSYLAEGNATKTYVGISNVDDNYINNVKEFAEKIGLSFYDKKDVGEFGKSRTLNISSIILSEFVRKNCGQGSNFKKVPDFAYSAKEEFVSSLLRGYFDGDGNFHVSRKMIRCSSNSEELIQGIALLLTRFGIFSFKTKDKKGQYWLLIPYKYAPLFLKHIGSDIQKKKEALEELSKLAEKYWNEKSQDYNDMISGFDDLFYQTAKKLGMRIRYVNNFTKRQKIGRTALFRYIKKFEKLAIEKNVDIENELRIMKRMFNSDVIWDEIVKIDYVKPEHPYVYDLSVPGLETFTTAEGIVTHNTLNVFHFAGVAEVGVTLGLPRLIELFDARKQPSTPRTEVFLKRGYKSDYDKVKKVSALLIETKLKDIATEFGLNLTKFRVEIILDRKKMGELKITDIYLANKLEESLKFKPKISKDKLILKPKTEEYELRQIYQLKEKSKELHIKGIKGITQVLPIKNNGEFTVICNGSNLKEIYEVEGVDTTKTITNNIFIVAEVLGIEAARQVIINEALDVIRQQGLDIDIRHVMFLSDAMTNSGRIKGITRGGITAEKESVLARASFETPIKHIVHASLIGEVDNLNSVIENVMVNQAVPLGTGLPDLVARMKKNKGKITK